jgi:hypothetical protein
VPTAVVILTPSLSRKWFALLESDADLVITEAYSRRRDKPLDAAFGSESEETV